MYPAPFESAALKGLGYGSALFELERPGSDKMSKCTIYTPDIFDFILFDYEDADNMSSLFQVLLHPSSKVATELPPEPPTGRLKLIHRLLPGSTR